MPIRGQIAQAIARSLNDLGVFTAASSSSTTAVLPQLITLASNPATSLENGAWLYNYNKSFQARGQSAGFTAFTGAVKVEPAWTAPSAGDTILVTRLFPMVAQVLTRDQGYDYFSNESARWLSFEYQMPITTVAGQSAYSLSASARWLVSRDQVISDESGGPILDPPIVANYVTSDGSWRRPGIDFLAGVPILNLASPYASSGETFYLRVRCPVIEVVNGADTQATMVLDTDAVNGDLGELTTVGTWLAARALGMGVGPDAASWAKAATDYEARARRLKHFYSRETPALPTVAPAPGPAAA